MTCGPSTGQCLGTAPLSRTCPGHQEPGGQCPVCCEPFSSIYGFNEVTTGGRHPGCFVAIFNDGQAEIGEQREGRWCSFGCAGQEGDFFRCDDAQSFETLANFLDGTRYLRGLTFADLDARGYQHDLRSNEYRKVPRFLLYLLGTCWRNDGTECFGVDVCQCFRRGDYVPPGPGGCQSPDGNAFVGEPLPFLLPDYMVRAGFGWAPTVVPGAPSNAAIEYGSMYCRKFADTRANLDTVSKILQVSAPRHGGIDGLTEPYLDPIMVSSTTCSFNMMTFCTGRIEKPPVQCDTAAWYTRGPGSSQNREFYNEDESRIRFDELTVQYQGIRIHCPEASTELQQASTDIKNRILAIATTQSFDGVRFDRLDSWVTRFVSNSHISRFGRDWTGAVELPGVFGRCSLERTGIEVTCHLFVSHIAAFATVVMERLRRRSDDSSLSDFAEPHCRFSIHCQLDIVVDSPAEPPIMRQWDGTEQPIRFVNDTIDPPIDAIVFRDTQDRPIRVPRLAEWRGFLGAASRPSSIDQRSDILTDRTPCDSVADQLQGTQVPGWPTVAGTRPEEPAEMFRGSVVLGF